MAPLGQIKLDWIELWDWSGLGCITTDFLTLRVCFFFWCQIGGKSFQRVAFVKSRPLMWLPSFRTSALARWRSARLPWRWNTRVHNLGIFHRRQVLDFKVAVAQVAGWKWRLACLSEKGAGGPDSHAGSHKIKGGGQHHRRSHSVSVRRHTKVDNSRQLTWLLRGKRGRSCSTSLLAPLSFQVV